MIPRGKSHWFCFLDRENETCTWGVFSSRSHSRDLSQRCDWLHFRFIRSPQAKHIVGGQKKSYEMNESARQIWMNTYVETLFTLLWGSKTHHRLFCFSMFLSFYHCLHALFVLISEWLSWPYSDFVITLGKSLNSFLLVRKLGTSLTGLPDNRYTLMPIIMVCQWP